MSAKKSTAKKEFTISMGIHKGEVATITKKKAPEGHVVVKVNGEEVTVSKSLLK